MQFSTSESSKKSKEEVKHKYLWPPQKESYNKPVWVLNPSSKHGKDKQSSRQNIWNQIYYHGYNV